MSKSGKLRGAFASLFCVGAMLLGARAHAAGTTAVDRDSQGDHQARADSSRRIETLPTEKG